jgi:pimeloyl-ACP methyl ester carboxylesterase
MSAVVSRVPGLVVTDHQVEVPLDHDDPGGACITLFARELVAPRKRDQDLPWLLFLQGGPGMLAPRPTGRSGWLGRALLDHRVLLLDQRGTGRSTPATRQTLAALGPAERQAAYLRHFRADSIVRDAELLRHRLAGGRPWTVLGQSYGGFVTLTYLSFAPEGLGSAIVTGGLPPLRRGADEVYRATHARVQSRYRRFVERYPADAQTLDAVADHLAARDIRLPCGDPLTVPRLQSAGHLLGSGDGLEVLHHLLERAWAGLPGAELSDAFLAELEACTAYVDQPLYAVLHEAIYCDGPGSASRWAAQRVRDSLPGFSPEARPLLPTGEMVYPWLFEQDRSLVPLAGAARLLAELDDWPRLYDLERLASNEVPVAAAIYHDDMYVEYAFSLETAQQLGACRWWVTSEFHHDGLRSDARVLDRLLDLAAGEA